MYLQCGRDCRPIHAITSNRIIKFSKNIRHSYDELCSFDSFLCRFLFGNGSRWVSLDQWPKTSFIGHKICLCEMFTHSYRHPFMTIAHMNIRTFLMLIFSSSSRFSLSILVGLLVGSLALSLSLLLIHILTQRCIAIYKCICVFSVHSCSFTQKHTRTTTVSTC